MMLPPDALDRLAAGVPSVFAVERTEYLGRPALVARVTEFRWRWMASRLHCIVVATTFDGAPTKPELDQYLAAATDYAMAQRGHVLRELHSVTMPVPIAISEHASQDALEWASRVHGRKLAAHPFPVSMALAERQLEMPKRMIFGGFYHPYVRQVVRSCADGLFAA